MLTYAHHSSRYDRTPESLAEHLLELVANHPDLGAIGLTEVQRERRVTYADRALYAFGWDVVSPDGTDAGLAYDEGRYELVHLTTGQVTDRRSWAKTGKERAPFVVLFALLRDRTTGHTLLVSVGHTPSNVQDGARWEDNHRARQHRDGMRGWRKLLRAHIKAWRPTAGVIVSMDLNLDTARKWVRGYLARCFPGLSLVTDPRPADTHGRRTIDVVLVSRKLSPRRWGNGKRVKVIRTAASDHKTVVTRLRAVARKARRKVKR